MTTHLGLQRIMIPGAQASALTTGSISLAGARGAFYDPGDFYSIATAQGDGTSATLSLTSIPQTYKHLQLRFSLRSDAGSGVKDTYIKFNSDTGSFYTRNWIFQIDGSTPYTSQGGVGTPASIGYITAWDTYPTTIGIIDIFSYSSTDKKKSARVFLGNEKTSSGSQQIQVYGINTYNKTNAITSIDLTLSGGNFTSTSKLALYGIN